MNKIKTKKIYYRSVFLVTFVLLLLFALQISIPYSVSAEKPNAKNVEETSLVNNDDSIFIFTITSNNECNVRLLDKSIDIAVVPSKAIINEREYTVTSVAGNGFASSINLEKVRLPKTVVSIGASAFANCKKLKSITIPAVQEINTNAFNLCTSLESIIIPETVVSVAPTILRNACTKVYVRASITETQSLGWATNWNANNINQEVEYNSQFTPQIEYKLVGINSRTSLQGYVVESAQPFSEVRDNKTHVYIPSTYEGLPVIEIANSAFAYNDIETLTIGYSKNSINIKSNAFNGLDGEKIIINRDITTDDTTWQGENILSEFLFADSTVSTIILPESISGIGDYMFNGCLELKNVHFITPIINNNEENLDTTLTSTNIIILPQNEKFNTIGDEAFSGVVFIKELHIPSNVVNVGERIAVNWGMSSLSQKINIAYDKEIDLPIYEESLKKGWHSNWKQGCNLSIIEFQGIYSIEYVLNGGNHLNNPTQYQSGSSDVLNDATKLGYQFVGWYDNEKFEGGNISSLKPEYSGNKIFYAKFSPNNYTVRYDSNIPKSASGSISGITSNTLHLYDNLSKLAQNGYGLDGYTFVEWNTMANGLGGKFDSSLEIENLTDVNNGIITLFAQWNANKHVVNYNLNKPAIATSNLDGLTDNSYHVYDTESLLTANEYSLVGWRFIGWNTMSNGLGNSFTNCQEVINLSNIDNDIVTLYAQWMQNTYFIKYNSNKPATAVDDVVGTMNPTAHQFDTPSSLRRNLFSLQAWTAIGWSTTPNGIVEFENNSNITTLNSMVDGVTELFAVWELTKFKIYLIDKNTNAQRFYDNYTYEDEVIFKDTEIMFVTIYDTHKIEKGSTGDKFIYYTTRSIVYNVKIIPRSKGNDIGHIEYKQIEYGESFVVTGNDIAGYNYKFMLVTLQEPGELTGDPKKDFIQYNEKSKRLKDLRIRDNMTCEIILAYEKNPVIEPDPDSCVAEGTIITLADGSHKAVEELTGNEQLLVWNLKTGAFDTAPILFIDSEERTNYEIINLFFSDGTVVKVIDEHAFWNSSLNKYAFLRADGAKYIGDSFNKQTTDANGKMIWTNVQLVDVEITNEVTTVWSPVTYSHLCYYVNGMLSMPGGTTGLINIFEVNPETMTIDVDKYNADIAEYGLFTYEEFAELYPVSEMVFNAFDAQYFKVAIGKGILTYEMIGDLLLTYGEFLN